MLKLFVIVSLWALSDSTKVDSTQNSKSVLFLNQEEVKQQQQLIRLKYQHQQGFFCDFEDKINKNRKLNLNLGVGEQ